MKPAPAETPIQPVERPILCSPYDAPSLHWHYDRASGEATKMAGRRPSRYWYRTKDQAAGQKMLELVEGQDDLVMVNQLRSDVARWREGGWENATDITKQLLRHWRSPDRPRRLFFCQLEAVETVIYLAEILQSRKKPRFKPEFPPADLAKLVDQPVNPDPLPLTRFGCKMATGSGKTVVMAMLVAWAFCNRGRNPADERFASGVLVCCPNLTIFERLQVLRPERPDNYFAAFDIVPAKLRPLMQNGRVLVLNWHKFALESEHAEGGRAFPVINKGAESAEAFARRVLGDLYDRMPIMVLNDEAHHCYRPAPITEEQRRTMTAEQLRKAKEENEEATVWVSGLDMLNNVEGGRGAGQTRPGIAMCVDLSATPFYIGGSGHAEGSPFPWLVSDFGLVDAIESGIVKIPRLPVSDTTGRPEPKYFKLYRHIVGGYGEPGQLQPGEYLPGKARKPKPEAVFREAEGALKQLAGQWVERFRYIEAASPGQERVPPVMIIVCDNTDLAEILYRKISGEEPLAVATEEDVAEVEAEENGDSEPGGGGRSKARPGVSFGHGVIFPDFFGNAPGVKRTIRIDTELLAQAESDEAGKSKRDAAEALRRVVATVGKPGEPGEHVRCVVSVQMLTEGWDANNVTHILGLRAFQSQLLCEQVVGRGLRRMDYTAVKDPDSGKELLTEEYVDVYGIPFTVVPFKGRPVKQQAPEDKPKNHVRALPERAHLELRFPVVEGYAFALKRNLIKCDIDGIPATPIESDREPTATFLLPTVGYQEGTPSQAAPFGFAKQDRKQYYSATHLQAIEFQIAQLVVAYLVGEQGGRPDARTRVWRLRSRHQLFPQVFRIVDEYVQRKVDFRDADPRELGLEQYVGRLVGLLCDAIEPDDAEGEPPLLPVLNRYQPFGTTGDVDFMTTLPCRGTQKSHINQVVLHTETWEASIAFRLEGSEAVACYARNERLGLLIPYEFRGVDHHYEPDFIVRLKNGATLILEVKGYEDAQANAKHNAAQRWVAAVNNAREHGVWAFHVCRDPQGIERELAWLSSHGDTSALNAAWSDPAGLRPG